MLEVLPSSPTVLFLVAENRLLRETLVRILTEKMDMKVAGAVAIAPALIDQLTASHAEVVLVDSSSLPSPGAHLLTNIRRSLPSARVVLIGMEANENTFFTALREGVMGYVLKDASAVEVLRVIRAVASGEAVCPACFSGNIPLRRPASGLDCRDDDSSGERPDAPRTTIGGTRALRINQQRSRVSPQSVGIHG
jgi:DNA-binding NarL/FixJ family response regulator